MKIKQQLVPPRFIFSKSHIMGASGTHYCGLISIATDFPLWFIVYVVCHELIHYISHFLPFSVTTKFRIETRNENLAIYLMKFLPEKYREKAKIDEEKVVRFFVEWRKQLF